MKPALIPKPRPFAAMIKLDDSGQIIKAFVDFKGLSSLPVTSVKEKGGHFFVGSLHNNFIGVFTEKKNNPLVDVW